MQRDLDTDGDPRRDAASLLPPVDLPRRMWAGSRITFLADIPLEARLQRRSTVTAVTPKTGRSDPTVFVTVEHEICLADVRAAIREQQDIVYRNGATGDPPSIPAGDSPVITAPFASFSRTLSCSSAIPR
nr:MaoC family dehydratase N-terminal domain-containing protein [Sphingomonas sp. ID1715]